MNRAVVVSISVVLFFSFLFFMSPAFSQSPSLIKGIEQYKDENYEEAVGLLKEARMEDPNSSAAAFFLGLAYKQVIDYPNALKHLQDAVTLRPKIREAAVELIDVALQLNKLDVAKKWIEVAENEKIYPAKIAFLKGLALRKEGKHMEAIESFKRAMSLDKGLTQAAEFQIALCYLSDRKLKAAKQQFQAAVLFDPSSDLASYARRYQDLVEQRIFIERPLRVTLGAFGQYDTNVVLQPVETALAPDITDAESRVLTTTLRVDYVPVFEGPWLFNAQYAFYGSFHDNFSTTHDVISNGIYVAPGYNFGRYALNIAASYNHALVRDPSYKRYLGYLSVGPLLRILVQQNHLLEFFTGYVSQKYYQPPLIPEEDRDSEGLSAYMSWIWSFGKAGFFNLRYDYSNDNTHGVNWANDGHRFSANVTIPLVPKLKLQISGQAFLQDFKNTNTVIEVKREDRVYRGSGGLTWDVYRNTSLILQYSRTRAKSNIEIYDYERDLYTAGIEYRF